MHVGVGGGAEGDALLSDLPQPQRIGAAAQRRGDLRRVADQRAGVAAVRVLRWLASRDAGLRKHLLQVGRPELVDLHMRVQGVVGRTGRLAAGVVDHQRAVDVVHADRRLAGDKPGPAFLRTPRRGQFATGQADPHALEVGRHVPDRLGHARALGAQRVDDLEKQRRGGFRPDERGIAAAVEIAHPHHQHVRAEAAGRPRIAERPRGAGFPVHAQAIGLGAAAVVRPRILAQHVHHHEAGCLAEQARAGHLRVACQQSQRAQLAAIGEHRVEAGQLLHGHFAAAQHQRQPVVLPAGQAADAGGAQEVVQIRMPQLRGYPDGGDVAAADQRVGGGDRTEEVAVEILRRVRAETRRHVAQHGLRQQHALVETQGVQKRLERGAGRALGQRAVDLPVDGAVEIIGRTDHRLDAHVAGVDQDRRRVVDAAPGVVCHVLAQRALQRVLQVQV